MLKTPDQPPGPAERLVGELVQQLVEDGKAYARAEYGLAKAIAEAKAKAFGLVAALFGAALILALAADHGAGGRNRDRARESHGSAGGGPCRAADLRRACRRTWLVRRPAAEA